MHLLSHSSLDKQKPICSVQNLSFSVAGQLLLDDISFAIKPGEFIGLIGPNGAGKSTLLRCLYRYHKPSKGKVYFQEKDIWQLKSKTFAQSVAVVLQNSPLFENISVYDLVSLGQIPQSKIGSLPSRENKSKVEQALHQVNLRDKCFQAFHVLSGGEKQRAFIARAIVQQAKFLILDEATSQLDINHQIQVIELVKSLGITVLASFHDVNLAGAYSDRIMVLNETKITHFDKPECVLTTNIIKDLYNVDSRISKNAFSQKPSVIYDYRANTSKSAGS